MHLNWCFIHSSYSRRYDADVIYKLIRRKLTNPTGHVSSSESDPINILNQLSCSDYSTRPTSSYLCASLRGRLGGQRVSTSGVASSLYTESHIWLFHLISMLSALDFSFEWCFKFRFTPKIWTKLKSLFCIVMINYITECNDTSKQVKQEEI